MRRKAERMRKTKWVGVNSRCLLNHDIVGWNGRCGVGGGLRGWMFRLKLQLFNIWESFCCVMYFQSAM